MDKGLIVHTLVLNGGGQVLVLQRQPNDRVSAGFWDVPGGTLEDGEDPALGAIRETREESGLSVEQPRIFHYTSNVDTTKNKQFVRLIFRARSAGGQVKLKPDEHSDFRWVDPASPPDLRFVDYLSACFKLLAELNK